MSIVSIKLIFIYYIIRHFVTQIHFKFILNSFYIIRSTQKHVFCSQAYCALEEPSLSFGEVGDEDAGFDESECVAATDELP